MLSGTMVHCYLHTTLACVKASACVLLGKASATVSSVRAVRITCFTVSRLGCIRGAIAGGCRGAALVRAGALGAQGLELGQVLGGELGVQLRLVLHALHVAVGRAQALLAAPHLRPQLLDLHLLLLRPAHHIPTIYSPVCKMVIIWGSALQTCSPNMLGDQRQMVGTDVLSKVYSGLSILITADPNASSRTRLPPANFKFLFTYHKLKQQRGQPKEQEPDIAGLSYVHSYR